MLCTDCLSFPPCHIYAIASLSPIVHIQVLFTKENFFAGGALKPTDIDMLWVHVTCAWFRPEVIFKNHEAMEPASGILKIPSNSFSKVQQYVERLS